MIVIDYGMGNLRSVSKALERLGADVRVSADPEDLQKADKLVLPGVGAFQDAMKELETRRLTPAILQHIKSGKPFLAICLGLQLLFSESEENPGVKGLCVFPGEVIRIRSTDVKIPHMGWNSVKLLRKHPVLEGLRDNAYFYFVHSYYAVPSDAGLLAGVTEYGNDKVCAMIAKDNVVAAQFHPEKSQDAGLEILKNFVNWKI